VKIDIHEQIYGWREVMEENDQIPIVKKEAMRVADKVLSHPALYQIVTATVSTALEILPHFAIYNRPNLWGQAPRCPRSRFGNISRMVQNSPPQDEREGWIMSSTRVLSRQRILDSVRANQPASQPTIAHFGARTAADLAATFCESIARMAGGVVTEDVPELDSFVRAKFPDAKVICSATPEYAGTVKPADLNHWAEASTIDVCIVRSAMGVAETGSILLSDIELQVNTIAFLAHDLVVLLDPKQIVGNIHDAYEHSHFKLRPYSVLMTGPSGSGDISGTTVHPAQGVKTLTVILSPVREARKRTG
jgi:L-lactate dehydrogenase complex protein LldG